MITRLCLILLYSPLHPCSLLTGGNYFPCKKNTNAYSTGTCILRYCEVDFTSYSACTKQFCWQNGYHLVGLLVLYWLVYVIFLLDPAIAVYIATEIQCSLIQRSFCYMGNWKSREWEWKFAQKAAWAETRQLGARRDLVHKHFQGWLGAHAILFTNQL